MNKRDRRQLRLMLTFIASYRAQRLALGFLIRDLGALLQALDEANETFAEAFHASWFDLEQVFAVALDRNYDEVLSEYRETIEKSLDELETLVRGQLAEDSHLANEEDDDLE